MSDYPMLISNKLHSFRNFQLQRYKKVSVKTNGNSISDLAMPNRTYLHSDKDSERRAEKKRFPDFLFREE